MGGLPQVFTGDRLIADNFIEEVKGYLRLNQDVAGYNSPIKKVALTLTLMKGPQVAGWTRDMGTWLDTLDPILDNIPDVWDQFLYEFSQQFQDSQRENRASVTDCPAYLIFSFLFRLSRSDSVRDSGPPCPLLTYLSMD